jgi:hypothetical protein
MSLYQLYQGKQRLCDALVEIGINVAGVPLEGYADLIRNHRFTPPPIPLSRSARVALSDANLMQDGTYTQDYLLDMPYAEDSYWAVMATQDSNDPNMTRILGQLFLVNDVNEVVREFDTLAWFASAPAQSGLQPFKPIADAGLFEPIVPYSQFIIRAVWNNADGREIANGAMAMVLILMRSEVDAPPAV